MKSTAVLAPIDNLILRVRKQRVILASDLARIYGVQTKVLNQAVKRNLSKFPKDFLFQLNRVEVKRVFHSRSQIVTLKRGSNVKYFPYVFTEHGAIMAANILKSRRAVQMSVFVVRAFVRLREVALVHRELAAKLKELERKVGGHDSNIHAIIKTLQHLMQSPEPSKRRIGFHVEESKAKYSVRADTGRPIS